MSKIAYINFDKKNMSISRGNNLKISLKKSVEVSRFIKGKKLSYVLTLLENVVDKRQIVPYLKYNRDMPHQKGKGISSGGYPINVAMKFLELTNSAKKNIESLNLVGTLYVLSVSARKGVTRMHNSRHSGRKIKSTNVEIILGLKSEVKK